MEFKHIPIMLNEVLSGLNINPDGLYVDCTLGGAGHSTEILKRLSSSGKLIGIDKDADAIEVCKNRLEAYNNKILVQNDFKNIKSILNDLKIDEIDGALLDLGVSSYQIDNADRGFSFNHDARLDMRMDKTQQISAFEVVNNYSEAKLMKIFFEYGEEPFSKSIARNIVKFRQNQPIETTFQLKDIIEHSMPKKNVYKSGGASKKVFQAIRIEVNGELDKLSNALEELISRLKIGGRIAIISFHSLEDRIVKTVLKNHATECICPPQIPICICHHHADLKLLNKKPLTATQEEQKINSRSSCAKLRIAEKI